MIRKMHVSIVMVVLMTVLMVLPAWAKVSEKEKIAGSQAELINEFGMPGQNKLVSPMEERSAQNVRSDNLLRDHLPLGAAVTPGGGVGEVIDNTYNDLQRYVNQGRNVEHSLDASGNVDVHFVYEEFNDLVGLEDTLVFANPNKTGYNVWNAIDSTWPWGQEAGCLIQSGDSIGGSAGTLDIMPNALVVISALDNFSAPSQAGGWRDSSGFVAYDGHWYWQEDRHSCFYDTGGVSGNSKILTPAEYQPGMLGSDSAESNVPIVAVQIVGSDTITHVAIAEWPSLTKPGGVSEYVYRAIKYFRKVGSNNAGSWEEEQIIDTAFSSGYPTMVASNWSDKVAIGWTDHGPYAYIQDQGQDIDCFYRESTNGGVDWNPTVNITQYSRDTSSATAFVEINALYDSQDRLHFLWSATPTSNKPYRDGYWWRDFSGNLYHWCDAAPTIINKVADANYTLDANSQVCGFGSPGSLYIAFSSISECDGNLYVVYNQIHHKIAELGIADGSLDCSTDAERLVRANWEVFVTVSSTLDGALWDAARNLTNTYTPGCDSALGDSGLCGSEYKPSVEKYGLNEAGLGLKWPAGALSDPDTIVFGTDSAYDGNYFLNIMYLDDEYPGSFYYTGDRRNETPRFNALKWLRLACVEPVQAPQIAASPRSVSWTDELAWVKNGESKNITITVTNDGNQVLDLFTIGTDETSGSGWLDASVASLSVPAGIPNTATFDVIVDASALTFGLGNSAWLDGEIYLKSDAGNNDSLVLTVHILAADAVELVKWDTAATSTAWDPAKGGPSASGDNTALAISNWGEFGAEGMSGNAQANLDFSKDGGECRTDDRGELYAWGGSPFIMQHDGGEANLRITTSFNLSDQAPEYSFDPLVTAQGITGGVSGGGEYDSVYSGAFANRDTSLILERTFFAPRNNPDNPSFVVCKTVVYSGDGQQHDNVTIGSFTDWDIPSVESPDNAVGTSAPGSLAGQFVYVQGTDIDTSDANLVCQENVNRYGAELFLDWYTNTEYNLDDCAANDTTWGSWGGSQAISDDEGAGEPDPQQWYDSLSAKNGVFANDSSYDQSVWVTYLFDHSVGATDTLTFYSLWATLRDGSFSTFEANLVDARAWYLTTIRGAACATCCTGNTVGNVDCQGIIDIGDVTVMIQNLFITLNDPCCEDEADVDQSGLVDIGDLTIIISSLFITLNDMSPCP